MPLKRRFTGGPGTELAFLGEEGTELELICNPDHPAPGNVEGISIGFKVKSVDEMIRFVESKGIEVKSGPFEPNPHIKFFYVKDPNGVDVQFVEGK